MEKHIWLQFNVNIHVRFSVCSSKTGNGAACAMDPLRPQQLWLSEFSMIAEKEQTCKRGILYALILYAHDIYEYRE